MLGDRKDPNVTHRRRCTSGSLSVKKPSRVDRSGCAIHLETNVITVIRIRPMFGEELLKGDPCIDVHESEAVVRVDENTEQVFHFSHTCGMEATQAEVYEKVALPLVKSAFEGYNVCIVAYGQTGSGKTYSMSGVANDFGIVPRFANDLFSGAAAKGDDGFKIRVAFYEIYIEKVYDVMSSSRKPLRVRGVQEVFVEGAAFLTVANFSNFLAAYHTASGRRATGTNGFHNASSRSHFITHILVEQAAKVDASEKSYLKSSIYLVDLAGSERLNAKCDASESISINCSLSVLHRLIFSAAGEGNACGSYRESALTYILRDCFGGNARMAFLATVSPAMDDSIFTRNTCDFATAVSGVRQNVKQNVSPLEVKVLELEAEVASLKDRMLLSFEPPKAPAVVELDEDPSMCTWKSIQKSEIFFSGSSLESNALGLALVEGGAVLLRVYVDGIALNGMVLVNGSEVKVSHGDRVVVQFGRCLLLFLDDSKKDVMLKHNYRSAKLEFLDANFSKLREDLESRVRSEAEAEKQAALNEMDEEIRSRRQELDRLEALKGRERASSKRERSSIATEISDRSLLRQRFEARSVNTVAIDALSTTAQLNAVNLQWRAKDVNLFIEHFGKQDEYEVVVRPEKEGGLNLWIEEKKSGNSNLVKAADFEELKNYLHEHFDVKNTREKEKEFGDYLFAFCRGRCETAKSQPVEIVQSALANSVMEVATERRMSIVDLRKSFQGGRTSAFSRRLTVALGNDVEEVDEEDRRIQKIIATLSSSIKEEDTIDDQSELVAAIVRDLDRMYVGIHTLRAIQRGAISGDAMVKMLIRGTMCVSRLSDFLRLPPLTNDHDVITAFGDVREAWKTCKGLYTAWLPLSQKVEQNGTGEQTLTVMSNSLEQVVSLIGKCAFWMGVTFPDEEIAEKVQEMFLEGMHKGLREAIDESASMRDKISTLLLPAGKALESLLAAMDLCTAESFAFGSKVFAVARRVILIARILVENGHTLTSWSAVGRSVQQKLERLVNCWRQEVDDCGENCAKMGRTIEIAMHALGRKPSSTMRG